MTEKSGKILMLIQIILMIMLMGLLVLFFIRRDTWIILSIIGVIITIVTLFTVSIILKRRSETAIQSNGMIKYYLLMAGILLAQVVMGFLFYLLASSVPIIFAILSLLIFFSLVFLWIHSRYKEQIKIFPKEKVLAQYKSVAKFSGLLLLIFMAGAILVKGVILLVRAI